MIRQLTFAILVGAALVSAGCEHRHRTTYAQENRVDINSATTRELSRLPGLTDDDAHRIVANRPYADTDALVRRGVIGPQKYDEIESYVYASGGRRWRDEGVRGDDSYRYDDDRYDHR